MSLIQQIIDTLGLNALKSRSIWRGLIIQINEFQAHNGARHRRSRSLRAPLDCAACEQAACSRRRQPDIKARLIEFLAKHPGSTAADIAKHLNLNPGSVSTRLTQLANTGQIQKEPRGYSVR